MFEAIDPNAGSPVTGGGSVVPGTPVDGSPNVPGNKPVAPGDTVENLSGGSVDLEEEVVDPGQPILREDISTMTPAEIFAMIFSALDRADQQRLSSAFAQGPQFKVSTQYSTDVKMYNSDNQPVQSKGNNENVQYRVTLTTSNVLIAETTLVDVPINAKDRNPHYFFPPSFVEGYQIKVLQPDGQVLLMPTLSLLGKSGKIDSFDISKEKADVATAVAYAEYIQGVINSGDVKAFALLAMPDDPAGAAQFAAVMEGQLLDASIAQMGLALGMGGLATQVQLQTQLVRDVSNAITDQNNLDAIMDGMDVASLAAQAGMSVEDFKAALQSAMQEVANAGPFNTYEALEASLMAAFEKNFTDANFVNSLVKNVKDATINFVVGNNYFHVVFDPSTINSEKTINTLTMSLLKNWGDNITQIAAQNKASALINDILKEDTLGRYKNAQEVKDAISKGLQDLFPDMEESMASDIANSVDLGLPKEGALYDVNNTLVMRPDDFRAQFANDYQSYLGISSNTSLGQALEHAVGITNPPSQTSYTGLMNESYAVADNESRAYLDPGTSAGETVRQQRLYDPGYQLVMQWSVFMDNNKNEAQLATQPPV